jgi:predicted amidohydrolase
MRIAVVNFKSKRKIDHNVMLMKEYISIAISNKVEFIVFPELCLTGYYYYLSNKGIINKEKLDEVVNAFLDISNKNNIYICFGTPTFINNNIFNSAVITCPDNTVKIYNKIHICGYEHNIFSKGTKPLVLETEFGKLGFGICYDTIRFPELIRYYCSQGANLYINLSAVTMDDQLDSKYLKRVIEYHVLSNGIYLASSNVCGIQNNEKFSGGSCVVGPERSTEIPIHYYCNSKLSIKPDIFTADIKLEDNLRMIYDGNRFSAVPDYNIKLYHSWYDQ